MVGNGASGSRVTLAGTTILRFDHVGLVVDHRDYWNESDRREPPYESWGQRAPPAAGGAPLSRPDSPPLSRAR